MGIFSWDITNIIENYFQNLLLQQIWILNRLIFFLRKRPLKIFILYIDTEKVGTLLRSEAHQW